jgi:pimeloyl-ACP methyl ester carboxylesterase
MKPWPGLAEFARSIRLSQAGLDLFLYEAGAPSDPPLLLVHGLGDEADTWRHILPELAQSRHIFAPDLPGFGRSDKPPVEYSVSFYAGVLLELLDQAEIEQCALVGHSLGAVLVQALALHYPERASRLVLIGGGLGMRQGLNLGTLAFIVPGLGEWLYRRLRKDPQKAYETLAPYYANLAALPEADRAFLFQRVNERVWSEGQQRAFFSTLRNLARWLPKQQKSLAAKLSQVSIPTLVVWGAEDRINPPANGSAVADKIPGARLALIPAAGHNVQQDQPEALIQHILGDH